MSVKISAAAIFRTLVLVSAAGLSACADINHLREAQDTFNQTAQIDNANRVIVAAADVGSRMIDQRTQIRTGYASVLLSLDSLKNSQKAKLRGYKLWGNVLMLRALSHFRLGNYDEAKKEAALAAALGDDKIFPRDKHLALTMPGLVKNQQALAKIDATEPVVAGATADPDREDRWKSVKSLLSGAVGDYRSVLNRKTLAASHPLRVYIYEAMLVAHRNYSAALSRFQKLAVDNPLSGPQNSSSQILVEMKKVMCAAGVNDNTIRGKLDAWAFIVSEETPPSAC